jgi:hypothetical protein
MSEATVDLPLFDCNVWIGRGVGGGPAGGRAPTAQSLLAEMDRLGVQEAAVYHIVARQHAPSTGNARLLTEIAGQPRLHPVSVVLPAHTGEAPPSDELVADLASNHIRLVRMFPAFEAGSHRFALREWVVGDLLGALEDAAIPLLLDFGLFRRSEPPWDDIVEVCSNHPALAVILVDVQGRNNRTLYPLLERFAGLVVQTAGFNVHRGIEDFVARFGANRLVFGSGFPTASMGAARFHLERADISEGDKAMIGSGNLHTLMGLADGATARR